MLPTLQRTAGVPEHICIIIGKIKTSERKNSEVLNLALLSECSLSMEGDVCCASW